MALDSESEVRRFSDDFFFFFFFFLPDMFFNYNVHDIFPLFIFSITGNVALRWSSLLK